jgi:branched-chain amino acid transport system permease protein
MLIIQVVINGIVLGGFYAAIAVGFTLVWGVMNIINVAHGTALMLGAYVSYWAFSLLGLDPFLSIPLSFAILFLAGYLLQKYLINFIIKAPLFMTFIVTYGVLLIGENLALYFWGADYRSAIPPYAGAGFSIGTLIIPYVRIGVLIVSLILVFSLFFFLEKTKTGLAIRATRMNRDAAKLMGANIGRVYAITYALGTAMVGAAGSLMSTAFMIGPAMGGGYLLRAFVVCILGGLGNINGALIGGLIFGLVEALGALFLGPGYQESISMGVMVLVLALKPTGILGRAYYEI